MFTDYNQESNVQEATTREKAIVNQSSQYKIRQQAQQFNRQKIQRKVISRMQKRGIKNNEQNQIKEISKICNDELKFWNDPYNLVSLKLNKQYKINYLKQMCTQ